MMIAGGADPTNVTARRVLAFLFDDFLALLVAAAVVSLFGMDLYVTETTRGTETLPPIQVRTLNLAALPIAFGTQLAYGAFTSVFLVASKGWTPGKLALGIRVVGWDGRPPGIAKAAIRGATKWVLGLFQCIYWIGGFAIMNISNGHKAPHDMIADTFVIDATYEGRLIMSTGGKIVAGPRSVSREEVEAANAQQAAITGVSVPAGKRATEPFYDKARDTYVVFSTKQESWMQLDKMSGQWIQLQ